MACLLFHLYHVLKEPNFSTCLSFKAKESRILEARQNSPNANKENVKPIEASAGIARSIGKGVYLWRCHAIYHPLPAASNLNFEAFAKAVSFFLFFFLLHLILLC